MGNPCFFLRSIDFLDKYFSGFCKEYSVAALSFRLIRYFKVSPGVNWADTPKYIFRARINTINFFISYLFILINHNSLFSIITSPIPLWEAMKAPPSTRLPS